MHRLVPALSLLLALGCSEDDAPPPLEVSNGLEVMPGIQASHSTSLAGACVLRTDNGEISCDDLVVRLNAAGVDHGIGWEVRPPTSPTCAGSDVSAPSIAVFSFGSLEIPEGSEVTVEGPHALALLAADTIELAGSLRARGSVGGFRADIWDDEDDDTQYYGPAPGADVPGEDPRGAGGAGGATEGGAGGNEGGAGGPSVPAQFEPLCGGSAGGTVGQYSPTKGGVIYGTGGGTGGAAFLLAAGDSITLDGPLSCGITVEGGVGEASERGGPGGGAGGTLSLESPTVTLGGECEVTAVGGIGSSSATGQIGGDAGDGATAPEAGSDGDYGGGGGGSAGFIRFRTASCPGETSSIRPSSTCEAI